MSDSAGFDINNDMFDDYVGLSYLFNSEGRDCFHPLLSGIGFNDFRYIGAAESTVGAPSYIPSDAVWSASPGLVADATLSTKTQETLF